MRPLFLTLFILLAHLSMAQTDGTDYQRILDQVEAGKYRTALEIADELFAGEAAAGRQDAMARLLGYRTDLTQRLEEDGTQAAFELLRKELETYPTLPIFQALTQLMLGEMLHGYAEQNSYRLREATQLADPTPPAADTPLDDYTLDQLLQASHSYLYGSLTLAQAQRTGLADIPAIVEEGDSLRRAELPTLYDLMLSRAMTVLASSLGSVADERPADPAELLVTARAFAGLNLAERYDTTQATTRKLRLYQEWIGYHLDDTDRAALLYADLERMAYIRQLGLADTAYLTALERMYGNYEGLAMRDRLLVLQARVYDRADTTLGQRTRVRALELLDRVGTEDPIAAQQAKQLRTSITRRELSLDHHTVYPREQRLLVSVAYRNIEEVFYRIYAYDPRTAESRNYREEDELRRLLRGEVVARGRRPLAANDDFSAHRTELSLDALASGGYIILVSDDNEFDPERATVAAATFQVSDLSALRMEGEEGYFVQVVDRTTGARQVGVQAIIRQRNRRGNGYRQVATRTSDDEGTFQLPNTSQYANYQVILNERGNELVTDLTEYDRRDDNRRPANYTTLLTDRPLYRPGQTVHVYGLYLRKDADLMPSILPDQAISLRLRDANYQEVATAEATSDEYGRFSTEFTLPEGGLTGQFIIETDNGRATIRVEEYKRPRFFVELEPDQTSVQKGDSTTVTGSAVTFAGPVVADARVRYRVFLEEVRWFYGYFRGGGGNTERQLVASGTTETDDEGKFTFPVVTSANLDARGYRRYRYAVEVDVADATGETHEAKTSVGLRGERPAVAVIPAAELANRGDTLTLNIALADSPDTVDAPVIDLRIVPVSKPNAALLERPWPVPDRPVIDRGAFERDFPHLAYAAVPELSEWPAAGSPVFTREDIRLGEMSTNLNLATDFPVGHYRIEWNYADGTEGTPATFAVYDVETVALPSGVLYQLHRETEEVEVGQTITYQLISAVELPLVHHRWASRSGETYGRNSTDNKLTLSYTPTQANRGGLSLDVAFVKFNGVREMQRRLALPWDDKQLSVTYATFRDKLRPGEPEQWTLELRTADGYGADAAALATMYDASLDQIYRGEPWPFEPYPMYYGRGSLVAQSSFGTDRGYMLSRRRSPSYSVPELPRLDLPFAQFSDLDRFVVREEMMVERASVRMRYAAAAPAVQEFEDAEVDEVMATGAAANQKQAEVAYGESGEEASRDAPPVQMRTNLQETAFFLPELTAGPGGSLRITFDSPQALTTWRFRLFAHDKALNYMLDEREVITQKELMILPNVPRFFREGDDIELTARVSNLSDGELLVNVDLELFDPKTGNEIDPLVFLPGAGAGAALTRKQISLSAGKSEAVGFLLSIPETLVASGMVGYRMIARSETFSDGEENVVPVLSDRTLVTVTKPFYLRKGDRKRVTLDLLENNDSESLQHVGYTFEATTNPAWLALKALPYLMEYPYDCTEQLANRYFANQLAYATVAERPVLQEVFERWQVDSTALLSELERNAQLKNALLTETPWVRAAQSEREQRERIGELFRLNRLAKEQGEALAKLAARQSSDGSYSWFPDGPGNRYMTQYVIETFARMRQLGVVGQDAEDLVERITRQAVRFLDQQLVEDYQRMLENTRDSAELREAYLPGPLQVHYLYARAVSGADRPAGEIAKALNFYQERVAENWTKYGLYEQALIAIAASKKTSDVLKTSDVFFEAATAKAIVTSLRERAIQKDEFGMYWKYDRGYRWHNLPIETHTRLFEAFQVVDPKQQELDEMRLWLLTNKRTNRWPTTKSTAAAVYALLNGGERFVATEEEQPLEAEWPQYDTEDLGTRVRALQEDAEAATGQFSMQFAGKAVNADLATVKLRNRGNDLVWGGIFWQYTERAERVQADDDGPLSLQRTLYKKVDDRLVRISETEPLNPGGRLTVRLELSTDRDMDYVHVKDRRAATCEPVKQLSGYRFSGGLGYYFAPNDLTTNFFIDHLPRGSYVLEYDLFVNYRGSFSSGLGRVECMYAPEFGGNTDGERIVVE